MAGKSGNSWKLKLRYLQGDPSSADNEIPESGSSPKNRGVTPLCYANHSCSNQDHPPLSHIPKHLEHSRRVAMDTCSMPYRNDNCPVPPYRTAPPQSILSQGSYPGLSSHRRAHTATTFPFCGNYLGSSSLSLRDL